MKSLAKDSTSSSRAAARTSERVDAGLGGDDHEYAREESQANFERLVALAAQLLDAPVALISLIDGPREIIHASVGMSRSKKAPDLSFCRRVVNKSELLVIPDTRRDARFCRHPAVVDKPHIRFYAGAPLNTRVGRCIGTLCVVDSKPRPDLTSAQRTALTDLAALVMDQWAWEYAEKAHDENRMRFENIAFTSPDAIVCADSGGLITFWNDAAHHIFGYSAAAAMGQDLALIVPGHLRGRHAAGIRRLASGESSRLIGQTLELEAIRRDGSRVPVELSLSMWRHGGQTSFGAIIRDISERRSNETRLSQLARRDALTGLSNRAGLLSRIEKSVMRGTPAALVLINLEGFKDINDTHGHAVGDRVLRAVGERIAACLRDRDTLARWGGDEFCVYLPGRADPKQVNKLCDRITASLSRLIALEGNELDVGTRMGIALFPDDAEDIEGVIANADLALYQARRERSQRCFFVPRLRKQAVSRRKYESRLHKALARREFEMFYQPQFRVSDAKLVGAEALIRWRHPDDGLIVPGVFLPALENSTLAGEVGDWVIATSCTQASQWRTSHGIDFRIGVNLFGMQFQIGDIEDTVRRILADTGLPASALELEITENIILSNDEAIVSPLRNLRAMGVGVAFDDYGTGYASLSLLKRYPLSRLKIDRSFVRDLGANAEDLAVVKAVLYLGKSFNLEVIAEGVENAEQLEILHRAGCEEAQGYLMGKPMPADEFEQRYLY